MAETATIGGVKISVAAGGSDVEGRTIFTYSMTGEGLHHAGADLRSGCGSGGREDRDGMISLLGFLAAAAESYGYTQRTGRESDNADLFPPKVVEWAHQHSDEISILAFDMEEEDSNPPDGYEVFFHNGERVADGDCWADSDGDPLPKGWYWWACFPGCLPDGDPMGPFSSEKEAIRDCREGLDS